MSTFIDRLAKQAAKKQADAMDDAGLDLSDMPNAADSVSADDAPTDAKNKLLTMLRGGGGGDSISLTDTPPFAPAPAQQRQVGPPPTSMMQPVSQPTTVVPQPPPAPAAPQQPAPPPGPVPAPAPQPAPAQPAPPAMPPAPPMMPPKQGSFIDRLLQKRALYPGMQAHPMMYQGQPMTSPHGTPQGAYNNAAALNPMYWQRPGVGGVGGFGGMPGMIPGMGMMPGMGMGGAMGSPRMDEETLKANHQAQEEQIKNLAGQFNPHTGRPYSQNELERRLASLNADTTRALQTMRSMQATYGKQESHPPQFNTPSMGQGVPGMGHPQSFALPGMGLPMGGGMPFGMPPQYGYGGYGMSPTFGMPNPANVSSSRSSELRRQLEEIRQRELAGQLEAEGGTVDRTAYEAQVKALREAARKTSDWSVSAKKFVDPLTGKPLQFGSPGFMGLLGDSRTWGTNDWKDFQTEYDKTEAMKRQLEARQRVNQQHLGTQSAERLRIQQELEEARAEEKAQRAQQLAAQQALHARMYGVPTQPQQPVQPQLGAQPSPHAQQPQPQQPTTSSAPPPTAPQQPAPHAPQPQQPERPVQIQPAESKPGYAPPPKLASVHRVTPLSFNTMCQMAARNIVKEANAKALKMLATLTAAGALGGGATSAMTAPYEYMPEAFLRGAGRGATMGAAIGAGGALGQAAGRAYGRMGLPAGSPVTFSETAHRLGGKALGGLTGGSLEFARQIHDNTPAPWESGELPLMERIDINLRRRAPSPFAPPGGIHQATPPSAFSKLSYVNSALQSMGMLSDRKAQQEHQETAKNTGLNAGLAGLKGTAVGAGGGSLLGTLAAAAHKRSLSRGAGIGALAGGLSGLVGGSLVGAHNGYVLGRDSNKPSNTLIERTFPRYHPELS